MEMARGHRADSQCGRPEGTQSEHLAGEHVDHKAHIAARLVRPRPIDADHRPLDGLGPVAELLGPNQLPVELGVAAAHTRVQLIPSGLVHRPNLPVPRLAVGHANRVVRIVHQVIGAAADRIDDPQRIRVDRHLLVVRSFFFEDRVLGKACPDDLNDRVLRIERATNHCVPRSLP